MRILWFTNTPSLAANRLNLENYGGGWISSLQKLIENVDDIILCVAFHHGYEIIQKITLNKTTYFAIPPPQKRNKIASLIQRWKHTIEPETQVKDYLQIVNEFQPDLIHVFGSEQAFGLLCNHIKTPILLQIQGNLTVCQKKWYAGLSRKEIFRYSGIMSLIKAHGIWHEYFPFVKRAHREQKIYANCQYFVGRTDWDRRITKALSKNGKYFHCDEMIRDDFFKHEWEKKDSGQIRIFSTIKPSTYKGLETILESANILQKKQYPFVWNIAGIDENEEIIRIIERVFDLTFRENNIRFMGSLGPDKLMEQLLQADCFVHPSHIENSPNSVCEAMLLGLPVIATYAGGTPSLLDNNKEGLLVQDGDPYAMAGAILEIVENPDFAENLGKSARKRAQERHNPEKILEDLLAIYHQVLSESSIKK